MRLQQQQSGVFYNQFLQPAMRRGLLWKKCATSRLGKGAILSYPILLLKVTQTLSQCQNQGKVLWEHVHFGSIWSSWAIPCSLVIWKMGASHTSYLGMSLLVGHTELSSLSLLQGLCEGSTEQHAPGLVLLSLTQREWRHTSFGIRTIKISRF